MSPLIVADLDVGGRRPDWTVMVAAPDGGWLRVARPRDRHLAYAWRTAAADAIRAAGVPPLRNGTVSVLAEVRRNVVGAWNVQLWLPTAKACALGLGDACGCIDQMVQHTPRLKLGTVPAPSLAGEVVLHITGERR